MFNIILLGPPGVGKGTQGIKLSDRYKMPIISTGDILREAARKKTPLGLKAKSYMDKGGLAPDNIIIGIVGDRLKDEDCSKGFILDGFPRTIAQAAGLEKILDELGRSVTHVIVLDVPEDEIVRRLSGRRICRDCGATYHLIFNPPNKDGRCDKCSGELYQRDDDNEETVRARLRVYNTQTRPLVDFYKERDVLYKVNGLGGIEDIFEKITHILER